MLWLRGRAPAARSSGRRWSSPTTGHDAERRTPLTLTEALDAFLEPPLDRVEIDLDIKLPGREEEIVEALRERGLVERAMISTMELYTLRPRSASWSRSCAAAGPIPK